MYNKSFAGCAPMELWHWILEHWPKSGEAGEFFSENAPLLAGVCAIVFTLIEVIGTVWKRRSHKSRGFFEHVRVFGLMVSILLATSIGLYTIQTKWMRKPAEIVWKEQIERGLHKCKAKLKEPALQEVAQTLKAKYETAELHCLAHAMQRVASEHRTATGRSLGANNFRTEIKFADALLAIPEVPTILQQSFSIRSDFLGYGYSLPIQSIRYSEATIHEYLIRNRCATWSESRCANPAQIDEQVYTWILGSAELAKKPNEKIGALIASQPPNSRQRAPDATEAKDAFAPLLKAIQDHNRLKSAPPILIRFAKFPKSNYSGTIGRLDAAYVFFSNLAEVWDKSINEADIASGRVVTPMSGDESLTFFIWLYFPSGDNDARLASWENVMYFLEHEVKVDNEVARTIE
jgi:hypothetical protein